MDLYVDSAKTLPWLRHPLDQEAYQRGIHGTQLPAFSLYAVIDLKKKKVFPIQDGKAHLPSFAFKLSSALSRLFKAARTLPLNFKSGLRRNHGLVLMSVFNLNFKSIL